MEKQEEEKKYYYLDEGEKIGPLTFTELKLSGLKRNTLVWHPGLENWKPAFEIEVLKFKFPDLGAKIIDGKISEGRKNTEAAVKVWKSSGYKDAPTVFMFFFIFICFMGALLIGAGENSSEKNMGIGMVLVSIIFLALFILFISIGKEEYRIGINYNEGVLWVKRSSQKKIHKEEWAGRIQEFIITSSTEKKLNVLVKVGGVPQRVRTKKWVLQVALDGSKFSWPVPGSVFYSKKDARAVSGVVATLL